MGVGYQPVALVTGSSSGFGLLAAVELARAGHRVFASMRDLERRGPLDQAAGVAGVTALPVQLDVTDEASIAAAVARIESAAGRIDVLVNNAGFVMGGFFEDLAPEDLKDQFETNFFGLAAVTRAVLPGMRSRGRGRVINLSSISGRVGNPGVSAYVASKWAVEGLSESLSHELARHGVQVVLIEPGFYPTGIATNARRGARTGAPDSPYAEDSRRLERIVTKLSRKKKDPLDVARAIVRAATASSPPLRVLVGSDARAEAFARTWLPSRLFERGVRWYVESMGRPPGRSE